MLVRELTDGQEIDQVLLVRARDPRARGELRLTLGDRTGRRAARRRRASGVLRAGRRACAWRGRYEPPRAARVVRALRAAEPGEYDLDDAARRAAALGRRSMEADLRELVATVQNRTCARCSTRVFGAGVADLARVPRGAGRQALPPGLPARAARALARRVAQAVSAISATFPGIDRDVAVTGALLHDIGKLDAYTADPLAIDMTDLGKLQGEIPLGYYRVRRADRGPARASRDELAAAVLHIILSHHGPLEHGSPVVPCTREATLVHMIDNLGGRLGSFDRLEKELPDGSRWSGYDRALGGGAWFAGAARPSAWSARARRAARRRSSRISCAAAWMRPRVLAPVGSSVIGRSAASTSAKPATIVSGVRRSWRSRRRRLGVGVGHVASRRCGRLRCSPRAARSRSRARACWPRAWSSRCGCGS